MSINISSIEKLIQLLGINKTLLALLTSALTFIYTKSFAWSIVTFCLTYFLALSTSNLFLFITKKYNIKKSKKTDLIAKRNFTLNIEAIIKRMAKNSRDWQIIEWILKQTPDSTYSNVFLSNDTDKQGFIMVLIHTYNLYSYGNIPLIDVRLEGVSEYTMIIAIDPSLLEIIKKIRKT